MTCKRHPGRSATTLLSLLVGLATATPASDCYAIKDPDQRSRCLAETR